MDRTGYLAEALHHREAANYNPASDGPEINFIQFFDLFPDGAGPRQLKMLGLTVKRTCKDAIRSFNFGGW